MAVAMAFAQQSSAKEFTTDGGWKGVWNTTVSVSSGWRAEAADKRLIGDKDAAVAKGFTTAATNNNAYTAARADGYLGGANSDVGNLNYNKGDRYSTLFKVITDLTLTQGDMGLKLGAKAWYDQALKSEDVLFGNQTNGFNGAVTAGAAAATAQTTLGSRRPLSDSGWPALNRFSGIELREAHVFNTFDVGGQKLQLKAGNQIVKWGNSVFLQGLNQVSPIDVTALRKPGTEIEEGYLPIWSLFGKLSLNDGMSVEGFYQFRATPTNLEACGTFFGQADFGIGSEGNWCNMVQAGGAQSWAVAMTDSAIASRADVMATRGRAARNGGQYGLAFSFSVKEVGNFGLYAMNISSRTPYVGGQIRYAGAAATGRTGTGAANGMLGQWDYVDNVRLYGLTFTTKLDTWRVGAELSHSPNQPVQINGNAIIGAGLTYAGAGAGSAALANFGPIGQRYVGFGGTVAGADAFHYFQGYEQFSKTQLLINGVTPIAKSVAGAFGASGGLFAAELGYQHSGVPEASFTANGTTAVPQTVLYGRAFIFGLPSYAATCGNTATGTQPQGCQTEGFFTRNAWGYRLRASLDYMDVFNSGWKVTPSVFFAHDVKGYSVDGQFNKGRQTLNLSLALNLNKQHDVVFGYTTYANSANYDVFRDRDNVTATYRYKF